jgi:hypothetical protein
VGELYRREFLPLLASRLLARGNPDPSRIVIHVNTMFDQAAHSGRGLTPAEISTFERYQQIAAREFAISGIFFDLHVTPGAYIHQQGYSDIPDQFLAPKMINLFVTDSLGYDIDRDRTGGSSTGPRPRTRAFARSPYFKTFLGLNDARPTTLPHEYAHHFTLDTQRSASMSGNLWADLRNDYWLWRQRHGVAIPEFRACSHSEWASLEFPATSAPVSSSHK